MKSTILLLLSALLAVALAAIIPQDDYKHPGFIEPEPEPEPEAVSAVPEIALIDPWATENDDRNKVINTDDLEAFLSEESPLAKINNAAAAAAAESHGEAYNMPKESWGRLNRGKIIPIDDGGDDDADDDDNNFDLRRGITASEICDHFHLIAWKSESLMGAVNWWKPLSVPVETPKTGPYLEVLRGLKQIQWRLQNVEKTLRLVSRFTKAEEEKITKCYFAYSGFTKKRTTTIPLGPGPVIIPHTKNLTAITRAQSQLQSQQFLPAGGGKGPAGKGPASFKSLIGLIGSKGLVCKSNCWARKRVHESLVLNGKAAKGVAKGLVRQFQDGIFRQYIAWDMENFEGLGSVLSKATFAFAD